MRAGSSCSMSRRGNCYDNAVMESFFSTVKSELADRFDTYGDAKMELFDYIEVFYNQRRRHSTLGQISPAAFERRANEEGVDPMENRQGRGFPQAPHPLSFSMRKEQTIEERSTQRNRPLNRIMAMAPRVSASARGIFHQDLGVHEARRRRDRGNTAGPQATFLPMVARIPRMMSSARQVFPGAVVYFFGAGCISPKSPAPAMSGIPFPSTL